MKTLDRWTTVFAAIAGFSSAVAAFQAYSQQRSTALNEIRPIIMFENWEYDEYADSKNRRNFPSKIYQKLRKRACVTRFRGIKAAEPVTH